MMVTLCRKKFLLIELNAFDASTKWAASQVSSSYIGFIACMINSQRASYPAQTCGVPTDVTISVRMWVTTTLPAIRRRTSPIPMGRRPGLLSSGITRNARNASKNADWFSMLQIFLMTSENALHRSKELFPKCFGVLYSSPTIFLHAWWYWTTLNFNCSFLFLFYDKTSEFNRMDCFWCIS